MEYLLRYVAYRPAFGLIEISVLIIACVILAGSILQSRAVFVKKMKRVMNDPELADVLIKSRYNSRQLLQRSRIVEKFCRKNGPELIPLTGMDDLWIEQLGSRKRKKDFWRVLMYAPEKGLFKCFLVSLEKKRFAGALKKWLEATGDFLQLRRLALAGKGEPFDGQEALNVFQDRISEIRELTGDPEWASRYFAVKILLHDSDERSVRAVWDAFSDSNHLIRKTVVREFVTMESERFLAVLRDLAFHDAVYEVRKSAWERIQLDFSHKFSLDTAKLKEGDVLHVLELLRPGYTRDENFALDHLTSDNLELRFSAANYLERSGVLARLCRNVDLGDKQALERNWKLLKKAVEVNVCAFLSVIEKSENPATLLLTGRVLLETGEDRYITILARRVFQLRREGAVPDDVYQMALDCISARGNEQALRLLKDELGRQKENTEEMSRLLAAVPVRGESVFLPALLNFLRDPGFGAKSALREALGRMAGPALLNELFTILKYDYENYPHAVRAEALKILVGMDLDYCLQTVLEHISMLPPDESRELTKIMTGYSKKILTGKLNDLLRTTDAKSRAAVISVLPVTGDNSFLKPVREALKDADPDVRVSSIWTLVEFNDAKSIQQASSMLRDPVDRVRLEAALALGEHGSKPVINRLREMLFDENEVSPVKKAVVRGLGRSSNPDSVDVLLDRLEEDDALKEELKNALSGKREKKEITRIVENFKDASPGLRELITQIFIAMKEDGEQTLAELLREDIPSLRPHIIEIFESTGYIEKMIRLISHRDPSVRKEAAAFLSLVGNQSAFRGIVLAARDPNEEVRVQVIKALEKLETKEGEELLHALENDPDRKVRKYTHWALERLRSKSL
jgi:HEAT repeat protein